MKEELTPQGEANSSSVDMETPMPEQGQIRLLSLSACLMQTFAAGMIQRKQNGLLAAKRVSCLLRFMLGINLILEPNEIPFSFEAT